MRALLVLLLTFVILAVQFHLGLRKKKLLGAVLPAVMAALFVFISLAGKTTEYIAAGILCVIAIVIVWAVGYAKSARHEKAALDKMRAKDLYRSTPEHSRQASARLPPQPLTSWGATTRRALPSSDHSLGAPPWNTPTRRVATAVPCRGG